MKFVSICKAGIVSGMLEGMFRIFDSNKKNVSLGNGQCKACQPADQFAEDDFLMIVLILRCIHPLNFLWS